MKRTSSHCVWLAGLLMSFADTGAKAQYVVVDTRGVADIRTGAILSDEQRIVVPEGSWLRVIGRDVKPVLLTGPLQGRTDTLVGTAGVAKIETSVLQHLASVLTQPFVVRGAADEEADYTAIDLLTPGRQCALGSPVLLRRPHSAGVATVELTLSSTEQKANLRWEASRPTWPWPKTVDLVDSAQYDVDVTSIIRDGQLRRRSTQFTLMVRPKVAADDSAAALSAFVGAGCNTQVLRLVHALVSGSVK